MSALKLLASDGFLCINKYLAKAFGLDAAVLLAELASTYNYWESQGGLTEDGMFFETVERIEENTTLTKYQQAKAVKALEDAGVLRTEKRGLPAKRYFGIDEEKVLEVVDHKKSKNFTTVGEKTEQQEGEFFDRNKNIPKKNKENDKRDIYNSASSDAASGKTDSKPSEKKPKWTAEDTLALITDSNLSEPLKEKVREWIQYKREERRFVYKERSSKSLISEVARAEQKHGSIAVINQIEKAMSSGWQGMNLNLIETNGSKNRNSNGDNSAAASLERLKAKGLIPT